MTAVRWATSSIIIAAAFQTVAQTPPNQDLATVPPEAAPGAARHAAQAKIIQFLSPHAKSPEELITTISPAWEDGRPIIDAAVESLARYFPDVETLMAEAAAQTKPGAIPAWLRDQAIDPFIRSNAAVWLGREWTRRQRLDEALEVLGAAKAGDVVDLPTYYFCLATCQTALQQKDAALRSLDALDQLEEVPPRYAATAAIMRATVEPLTRDKLDGIAHDMRDVRRRLQIGRTDKKLEELETDIVARLDRLIKAEEDRRNQNNNDGGGGGGDDPLPDSRIMNEKGAGKAAARTFSKKGAWGAMPEKERERALQDIGRQFPAHYRDAIEEYFRKLAGTKQEK